MPRQLEAKKDVIHCEKSWGVVNKHRSANIRMGKPTEQSVLYGEYIVIKGERRELKHLSTCRKGNQPRLRK